MQNFWLHPIHFILVGKKGYASPVPALLWCGVVFTRKGRGEKFLFSRRLVFCHFFSCIVSLLLWLLSLVTGLALSFLILASTLLPLPYFSPLKNSIWVSISSFFTSHFDLFTYLVYRYLPSFAHLFSSPSFSYFFLFSCPCSPPFSFFWLAGCWPPSIHIICFGVALHLCYAIN